MKLKEKMRRPNGPAIDEKQCQVCKRVFATRQVRIMHENKSNGKTCKSRCFTKDGKNRWECRACVNPKRSFTQACSLQRHVQDDHDPETVAQFYPDYFQNALHKRHPKFRDCWLHLVTNDEVPSDLLSHASNCFNFDQ